MQITEYTTKQDINFYIEKNPISKEYQRILFKDKNNNWNYVYKNSFDNFDSLNTKDIKHLRFFALNNGIKLITIK
jgi:hypothetical protein